MTTEVLALLAAVPPEIAGLPTWALNGLSIGSLVTFVLVGLGTARLWTKRQVDELVKQHEREMKASEANHTREMATVETGHAREMADVKDRYETHIRRTVELWQGRAEDALQREKDWREVARTWEQSANLLANGLEGLQDQGEGMLRIVQAWQAETRRRDGDS